MSKITLLAAVLIGTSMTPALAYIDPITGSVILQALIGGFAALSIAVRQVRERILGVFGIKSKVSEKVKTEESAK